MTEMNDLLKLAIEGHPAAWFVGTIRNSPRDEFQGVRARRRRLWNTSSP
jgi:hypothetical protein